MARTYKDTLTVKRVVDGWEVKMHGYPFYWNASTAEECLRAAGREIDMMEAQFVKARGVLNERDQCSS